jgi:murein DD-endopeptidase MepM/ murein hydrolase activator NlpD
MTRPYDHEAEAAGPRRAAPSWDWPPTDGALALEWEEVAPRARPEPGGPRLIEVGGSDSVPRMAWPEAPGLAARAALRERERARVRRARRLAALTVAAAVALVVLLLAAFGSGDAQLVGAAGPAPAHRLLPSGPPRPQVVAMHDTLRIQLPVNQARVTAIGYHGAGETALELEPVGSQTNAGAFGRIVQRLVGEDGSGLRFYLLEGGEGPRTGGLDVGAPEGTDVYAPVDGTVIAISDRIVDGRAYGKRIELQPAGNPGVVVSLTNVELDRALTVGSTVVAARTKIGRVIDLSDVERAGLARYTHDRGQHVHIELRFATSLAAP